MPASSASESKAARRSSRSFNSNRVIRTRYDRMPVAQRTAIFRIAADRAGAYSADLFVPSRPNPIAGAALPGARRQARAACATQEFAIRERATLRPCALPAYWKAISKHSAAPGRLSYQPCRERCSIRKVDRARVQSSDRTNRPALRPLPCPPPRLMG